MLFGKIAGGGARSVEDLAGWGFTVGRNSARRALRQLRREAKRVALGAPVPGMKEELRERLRGALESGAAAKVLTPRQLAVVQVVLRTATLKDAARELGVAVKNLKTTMSRAAARLRRFFDEGGLLPWSGSYPHETR